MITLFKLITKIIMKKIISRINISDEQQEYRSRGSCIYNQTHSEEVIRI